MKHFVLSVAYLSIFLLVQTPSSKEWRGLSPLTSTRADVERALGKPDVNHQNLVWTYYLSDSVATFNFYGNPSCGQKLLPPSWNVPSDTLTSFGIALKQPVLVKDFTSDLIRLKKVPGDFDLTDHFYYLNEDDGFSIEVGQGYVMGYIYEPSIKKKALRCPHIDELRAQPGSPAGD